MSVISALLFIITYYCCKSESLLIKIKIVIVKVMMWQIIRYDIYNIKIFLAKKIFGAVELQFQRNQSF